ncbi:MAG TPA: hypothetical protein VNT30_15920 [Stellaceae bacterium]|nr:hypothetical protein [Stellaceae bacterium]
MSTLSDALGAIKAIILIEERVKSQTTKLEKLSEAMIDLDRRLVRVETTLDLVLHRGPSLDNPPMLPET